MSRWYRLTSGNAMREFLAAVSKGSGRFNMVGMSAVLGLAAVAFGISLIPGPNMFYLASRSITQGRGAGLISLAGVAVGFGVYLGAAVAGLAAVFAVVPVAYTMLKVAGGVYLLYL